MRTTAREDWWIRWANSASIYVLILCIFLISGLSVVDVAVTPLNRQISDDTEIPIDLYRALVAIFYFSGFLWMLSEWYTEELVWDRRQHNVAHNFMSVFTITLIILIYTATQPQGFFMFIVLFTLVYLPSTALFLLHWIYEKGHTGSMRFAPLGLFTTYTFPSPETTPAQSSSSQS